MLKKHSRYGLITVTIPPVQIAQNPFETEVGHLPGDRADKFRVVAFEINGQRPVAMLPTGR